MEVTDERQLQPLENTSLKRIKIWLIVRSGTEEENPFIFHGPSRSYTAQRCDCRTIYSQGFGEECGKNILCLEYVMDQNIENFIIVLRNLRAAIKRAYVQAMRDDVEHAVVELFCRSGLHRSVAMATYAEALMRAEGLRCQWCYWDYLCWMPARNHHCNDCNKVWDLQELRQALGENRFAVLMGEWERDKCWISDLPLETVDVTINSERKRNVPEGSLPECQTDDLEKQVMDVGFDGHEETLCTSVSQLMEVFKGQFQDGR